VRLPGRGLRGNRQRDRRHGQTRQRRQGQSHRE
jgi:hypothetical protein